MGSHEFLKKLVGSLGPFSMNGFCKHGLNTIVLGSQLERFRIGTGLNPDAGVGKGPSCRLTIFGNLRKGCSGTPKFTVDQGPKVVVSIEIDNENILVMGRKALKVSPSGFVPTTKDNR